MVHFISGHKLQRICLNDLLEIVPLLPSLLQIENTLRFKGCRNSLPKAEAVYLAALVWLIIKYSLK